MSVERVVVVMILSRTLSSFDYGTYQQVWLFYSLALPLFTLGLPSSILYFIPRAHSLQRKTVAFQTLFLLQAIGLAFSLATFLTAPWAAKLFNNPDLVQYLRIFSLYPLLALPPKLVNLLLIAEDRAGLATVVSALSALITLLFLTVPSLIKMPLVYTFYSANLGAFLFFVWVIVYMIRFYRGQPFHWNLSLLKGQIVYALPLGLSSMLGVISKQLDKAVVSSAFSPDVYAVYVNGAFEIPVIGLLTGSMMTVLIPEFVRRLEHDSSQAGVWSLWNAATKKTALFLFPISFALFVFAPEFMVVMFSLEYLASASIFRIYLALTVLRITQYSALLQALGRTRLILGTSIIGLFISLALSWSLVHLLGLVGPAWANVTATYLWAFIYLVILCRLLDTRFGRVMPWKELARTMTAAIVASLVAWPVKALPVGHLPVLVLGSAVYAVAYVVMLLATHTVSVPEFRGAVGRLVEAFR